MRSRQTLPTRNGRGGLMESLQQMQPELYVVIDLIGTVGTCVHTPDLASYECNTAT
jgi:hypothetical protein